MIAEYAAAETRETSGGVVNGRGIVASRRSGGGPELSGRGRDLGDDVEIGVGSSIGVIRIEGFPSGGSSGVTERVGVDTRASGSVWNDKVASDQLINGLMRWSQLYPRTRSHEASRLVT